MYFKERENSPLYKHYQQQEHQRLARKIEKIKLNSPRHIISTPSLPSITRRSTPRPYQQSLLDA